MSNVILFVFEGRKTEPQIFESLKKHFFSSNSNTILFATYNTSIYSLYNKIKDDDYLDIFYFIKNLNAENNEALKGYSREQISQIFLFFDYDNHCSNADDEKIKFMFGKFNNETENGKLFINYPMVESLRDLATWEKNCDISKCTIDFEQIINYKNMVHVQPNSIDRQIIKMSKENWYTVTDVSLQRANWIVKSVNEKPDERAADFLDQTNIFSKQKSKFVKQKLIAILNAFPMFLFEYFGYKHFFDNKDLE